MAHPVKIIRLFFVAVVLFASLPLSAVQVRTPETAEEHEDPLTHHIVDQPYVEFPGVKINLPQFEPLKIGNTEINLSITAHFVFFWVGAFLMFLIVRSYKRKNLVQKSFMGQMVEAIVLFVRDDLVKPSMPHHYEKYMPLFLTFFFFILVQNVMGLVPFLSQCTKNLSVTAALALVTFVVWQISALKKNGVWGYMKTMMPISKGDMPLPAVIGLNVFMFPMEFLQVFTKSGVLAIRLFATMMSGHAVILTFLLLGYGGEQAGWGIVGSVSGLGASVAIYLLECLIAFLQAYVFTLLSAIFIGSSLEGSH